MPWRRRRSFSSPFTRPCLSSCWRAWCACAGWVPWGSSCRRSGWRWSSGFPTSSPGISPPARPCSPRSTSPRTSWATTGPRSCCCGPARSSTNSFAPGGGKATSGPRPGPGPRPARSWWRPWGTGRCGSNRSPRPRGPRRSSTWRWCRGTSTSSERARPRSSRPTSRPTRTSRRGTATQTWSSGPSPRWSIGCRRTPGSSRRGSCRRAIPT